MSQDKGKLFHLNSVEEMSLYTTMVLKGFLSNTESIEDKLKHLVRVLEYNLNRIEGDRKWFFDTLKDHARVFNREWQINIEGLLEKGIVAYDTLLLVIFLRLGVENIWMLGGGVISVYSSVVMELLTALYSPEKPTFALKSLNQGQSLFEYLAKHSPGLEEVFIPRSDLDAFHSCMKFKNLRVLELGGRIADKVLCSSLWNVNKKSEKVVEMALKESKNPDSWSLTLPHLSVLRNLRDQNSLKVSLGAAALLLQPNMEVVETLSWDTVSAMSHILDIELNLKNSRNERRFTLTKLLIDYHRVFNGPDLQRLFRVCPNLNNVCLLESQITLTHLDLLTRLLRSVNLKCFTLDTTDLNPEDLASLLKATPRLTRLTLHTSPLDLSRFQSLWSDKTSSAASSVCPVGVLGSLTSLTLNFASTGPSHSEGDDEDYSKEVKKIVKRFLSNFKMVTTLNLHNTAFLSPGHLVTGCIEAALEQMQGLQHLTIVACRDIPSDELQAKEHHHLHHHHHHHRSNHHNHHHSNDEEDSTSAFLSQLYSPNHYTKVRQMLPNLQKPPFFKLLCKLKWLEVDRVYASSRFDRIIAVLRTMGVLVAVNSSGVAITTTVDHDGEKHVEVEVL